MREDGVRRPGEVNEKDFLGRRPRFGAAASTYCDNFIYIRVTYRAWDGSPRGGGRYTYHGFDVGKSSIIVAPGRAARARRTRTTYARRPDDDDSPGGKIPITQCSDQSIAFQSARETDRIWPGVTN